MGTVEVAEKAVKSMDKQVVATKKSKTKRQRRKDLQHGSDKNKWLIQHPKIQSMDRREQIYIKDAGLNETKAEKRQAPIDPKLDLMSPEVKFGRLLAGTDQRKRHAAVKKLKAYLKARCDISEVIDGDGSGAANISGGISELDLLKLWKALWYTLYMADKRPVQDELSKHICQLLWCVVGTEEEDECAGRAYLEMTENEERELEEEEQNDEEEDEEDDEDVTLEELVNTFKDGKDGNDDDEDSEEGDDEMEDEESDDIMEMDDREIPHCRGAHLVSLFVRTFFSTIRRDWGSMDKYRIDKFYALIRVMMHEIYTYMSVRSWDYGIVLLLNDAIFAETLKEPPNGLRYHLIDLCLGELAKVNAKAKITLTEATFLDVLEPFFGLCQTGRHDDTIQARVTEKVIDNFLENYCVVSENALREEDDDDKEEDKGASLIFKDVHVKTIAEFLFTLGSDPDTKDKYRKSLYDLHKKYMRRLKKIGKDVEILTDEDGNEIYDENKGADDVNLSNIDESIQFLEAETNEEIPSDAEDDLENGDVDMLDDEPAKEEESAEKAKKESKKKKKKKRKSLDQEPDPEPEVTPITNDTVVNEKRKKKKKKSDSREAAADEEVVITVTEQQDAKKKDRKSKKKLMKQKEEEKASADSEKKEKKGEKTGRRVSFGAKNRAKSHKASMKALRTTEPPNPKETAPEKGILRKILRHKPKGGKSIGSVLSKKQRKKATSYF